MPPPKHRVKGPLEGGASSGADVVPQRKLRGKSTGSREKAGGAGDTGPSLANFSNLIGSAHEDPPTPKPNSIPITTTQPPLWNAREMKYTRPWSSSFPSQPLSSSIADSSFTSPSLDDHPGNTGARGCVPWLGPTQKPGTGLSGPPSSCLTVKAGRAFSLEAPPNHLGVTNLNVETQLEHQSVMGSSGGAPRKHQASLSGGTPRKDQASLCGGTPRNYQAVAGSSGGMTRKHQAVSGLSGRMPPKHQAVTGSNRGTPWKHQADTDSSRGTLQKRQAVTDSSRGTPRKHQAVTGSSEGTPQKHQAVMGLSGGTPQKHQAVMGSSRGTPRKYQAFTGLTRGMAPNNRMKEKSGGALRAEMPQRSSIKDSIKPFRQLPHLGNRRARSIAELPATSEKHSAVPRKSLLTGQKPRRTSSSHLNTTKDKKKSTAYVDERHIEDNTTKDKKKSDVPVDERRIEEIVINSHEVEYAIQELNELGLGYDISYEEFEGYLELLPCRDFKIDTSLRPDGDQLNELQVRDVLYHIKYCKFTRQRRKNNEIHNARLEDDQLCRLEEELECHEEDVAKLEGIQLLTYLAKEGLLRHIENKDLFDWTFGYYNIVGLDDYQRLVPENYGGCEYEDWKTYRGYFNSYEIDIEYLRYWKELLTELKWMEGFVRMKKPSLKWGKICTRGCYQAIKIASRFSMITESLARGGYYECLDSMVMDILWYKELDGIYFEIWQRITKLKESFKEALNEVYKSEKFPLRRYKMKDALDNDCSDMEKEFGSCTVGITLEVTEEKGRELIAHAIRNQKERPKFYAQYVERKIEIAKAVGMIPTVVT